MYIVCARPSPNTARCILGLRRHVRRALGIQDHVEEEARPVELRVVEVPKRPALLGRGVGEAPIVGLGLARADERLGVRGVVVVPGRGRLVEEPEARGAGCLFWGGEER